MNNTTLNILEILKHLITTRNNDNKEKTLNNYVNDLVLKDLFTSEGKIFYIRSH